MRSLSLPMRFVISKFMEIKSTSYERSLSLPMLFVISKFMEIPHASYAHTEMV